MVTTHVYNMNRPNVTEEYQGEYNITAPTYYKQSVAEYNTNAYNATPSPSHMIRTK